jgi:tight adherence protein B
MVILWAGGAIAVILLAVGIGFSISSERTLVEERLGQYLEPEKKKADAAKQTTTPLTDWLNRRVEGSSCPGLNHQAHS